MEELIERIKQAETEMFPIINEGDIEQLQLTFNRTIEDVPQVLTHEECPYHEVRYEGAMTDSVKYSQEQTNKYISIQNK